MKKIILLFVSAIFLLVSCNDNKGINVPTSDSIKKGVAKAIHGEYDPATKTTRTKVVETLCNEE